jgi:hypothetical protein
VNEIRTPTFQLADLLLPDGLEAYVSAKRADGKSWRRIARDLWIDTDHRVDVTFETLRQWFPAEEAAS